MGPSKVGNRLSEESVFSKSLNWGCCISPTLFKFVSKKYYERGKWSVKEWS